MKRKNKIISLIGVLLLLALVFSVSIYAELKGKKDDENVKSTAEFDTVQGLDEISTVLGGDFSNGYTVVLTADEVTNNIGDTLTEENNGGIVENGGSSNIESGGSVAPENVGGDGTAHDNTGGDSILPDDVGGEENDNNGENLDTGTGVEENIFKKFFDEMSNYLGEILCGLTFIGSLVLAFAYKKGLLPLLQGALSALSNTVGKIKDSNDERIIGTKEFTELINEKLQKTEDAINMISNNFTRLELSLKENAEELDEKERYKLVVRSQIDMLYDLFMTSSLPQYQKDQIEGKINMMREELGELDKQQIE